MRNILYITPSCPFARSSGGEVRSAALLEALDALGDVQVLQIYPYGSTLQASMDESSARPKLMLAVEEVRNPFRRYRPSMRATALVAKCLERPIESYSHIVSRYIWGAFQLDVPPSVKRVADLDDCVFRYDAVDAAGGLAQLTLSRMKRTVLEGIERRAALQLDGAFVVARRDRNYVRGMPVALLENVYEARPEHRVPGRARCLFVGTLTYEPNREGLVWFLTHCWQEIRRRLAGATMTVVGKAPGDFTRWAQSLPGVSVLGFVESLESVYRDADVVVAPVFSGGGALIKILEAIAYSRPVVASRFAADGYRGSLDQDRHLASCDSAGAFIDSVVRYASDRAEAERVARDARSALCLHFNQSRFNQSVSDLLDEVDRNPTRSRAIGLRMQPQT